MLGEVRQNKELAEAANRLLLLADVRSTLPTPVDRLVEVAGLTQPAYSLLADDAISAAPDHLKASMSKLVGKVMAVLDRQEREIHVRPEHANSSAFKKLHEVGHHIIPWQSELAYADDNFTLSSETNTLFELEASHVAAELLFQQGLLAEHAASHRRRASTVIRLSEEFGSTIHSTFRRYVESHPKPIAGVVLKPTPVREMPPCFERQEAFGSASWLQRFASPRTWPILLAEPPFAPLSVLAAEMSTLLLTGEAGYPHARIEWPDINGELRPVRIEAFSNTYRIFLVLVPSRRIRAGAPDLR